MDQAFFEDIIHDVLDHLPGWVSEELANVEIRVEDSPPADLVTEEGPPLGLYVGTPLTEREANFAGELPDVISIYRLPHLELGLSGNELTEEVRTTLIHEIAHYFGIDDDHLDEIGWG